MQVKSSSIFSTPVSKQCQQSNNNHMKQLNKEQLIQQLEQSLKRQHLQKCTSDMLSRALQQIVQKNDQEIRFLKQENAYLTDCKAEYTRKIDQLKHSYEQKIEKLKQQINQTKNIKELFNIEKERMKLQHQQNIADLQRQLQQKKQKISSLQGKIHKMTIQKLQTEEDQTISLPFPVNMNQISRMSNLSNIHHGNNMSLSAYRNQNMGQRVSSDLCSQASLLGQLGNSTVKYSKQVGYPSSQNYGNMNSMNISRIYQNKQNQYSNISNHSTIKNQNKIVSSMSNLKNSKINASQGKTSMRKQEIKMRMKEIKEKQRQIQQQSQLHFSQLGNSKNTLMDKSRSNRASKTYLI